MAASLGRARLLAEWRAVRVHRPNWLWLLIGFAFLPFVACQTVIPAAAWIAPVFLLRFVRTSRRTMGPLALVICAYVLAVAIGSRGGGEIDLLGLLGLSLLALTRGVAFTLPYAADRLLGSRLGPWPRLFIFPMTFVTVEWTMAQEWLLGTFASPAYSQSGDLPLMQIVSVFGLWAVTFLLAWFATTVNALWEHDFDMRRTRGAVGLLATVLAAVLVFGGARLSFAPSSAPTTLAATITIDRSVSERANAAVRWVSFYKAGDAERAEARSHLMPTVDQMLARTEAALGSGAKLVGWSEASAVVLEEDKPAVLARVSELARRYDAYIQVWLAVATRTDGFPFVRNQSILIDDHGDLRWTYDKTYPVIGAESIVTIRGDGVLPVADTPYGRLATAICNDMQFPELLRQAGRQDVDILFAPTNDVPPTGIWSGTNAAMATHRAIENGFSLIRAAGYGYSLIVDYRGQVRGSQSYFGDAGGIMLAEIPTRGVTTVYDRIGDTFAYLCIAGLVAGIAMAVSQGGRAGRLHPTS